MTLREAILTGLVLSLLVFQSLVLVILVFFPYLPDPGLAALNAQVYELLAPLSTVLLLGLLYAWLVRLGTREARRRWAWLNLFIRFISEPFQKVVSSIKTTSLSDTAKTLKILSHPRLMLAISLCVSTLLAFAPYRPDLNPTGSLVGIDSPLYVGWIGQMLARPWPQALQYSFVEGLEGSRPLLLVLLYLVASAGISPSQILEYLPTVLAPLLSLSTYVFVRYGHGSSSLAGLTAIFSSVSLYTTVGLWGGYYANWLALIIVYLFLTNLLILSRSPSRLKYSALYSLSVALFLTHPWTWVLVVTVSLIFAISLYRETGTLVQVKPCIGVIMTGVVLDLVKSWAFATRAVGVDVAGTFQSAGLTQMANFWPNLVDALLYTHGELLANWIILGIGLLAAFTLRFKDQFERLLLLWVAVASIPFLILDSYHQARIVYDLPISVLLSVVVLFSLPLIETRNLRWTGLIAALILVTIANYGVQGVLQL